MQKYAEIARAYLKTQLAWRADVFFNMLFTITRILFAYLLWGVIFEGKDTVSGFTFHGMLSYYIVSSFLSQLEMSEGISREIFQRIRNGTFSKYMVIPVNIQGYFTAMETGIVLFYLAFDFLAAFVWVWIFRIEFVFTTDPRVIIGGAVMAVLGLVFMVQLNYYLGILALKYEGIGTLLMIKNNLITLVSGSMVPLILFPEVVLNCLKLLPFYYVTYLPAMLFTGRCAEEAGKGLLILALWCGVIQLLIQATWKKYSRKFDGVGI